MNHVGTALSVVSNEAIPMHSVMDSQHRPLSICSIPSIPFNFKCNRSTVKMSDKRETGETHHPASDYGLKFH